jgi:transcriptional regulator with XRE-family HTH domain
MSEPRRDIYKTCRESACLTQEQASEFLHVSVRTLSDYENGHAKVPDDVAFEMSKAYHRPLLAYYHLKWFNPCGACLPEVQEPQTNGDMAFQAIIARDELSPAVDVLKRIVADGVVDIEEKEEFAACINEMKTVNGKILSVVSFAERQGMV